MKACWEVDPDTRPSFTVLRNRLEKLMDEDNLYIDVNFEDFEDYCAIESEGESTSDPVAVLPCENSSTTTI